MSTDFERDKREAEQRRGVERGAPVDPRLGGEVYGADDARMATRRASSGGTLGGVGLEEEARMEETVRRGTRRAMDQKEQEESGGGGLYGSQIDDSHMVGAGIAELVGTLILVFVVMAVATDDRAPAAIAPIAVGFALAVGVFIAGPVTGGAVNPVRAIGPMIVAGDLTSFWLYVLGPMVGGVLAALLYDRTMAQTEAPA
jgi:Major intrinsic protein